MYLEIVMIGGAAEEILQGFSKRGRVFIGPFANDAVRDLFKENWQWELGLGGFNKNQVKFLSCSRVPAGYKAIRPRDFAEFEKAE